MGNNDYSISLAKANWISVLLFIPISLLFFGSYALVWGAEKGGNDFTIFYESPLLFLVLIVGGIILHELIHGVTWMWFGGKSWSVIKFGVNFKAMAPYAHCREPLPATAYRWGAAMPGIVLGLIPFLVGLLTGDGWFTLFGYLFSLTASGDILILWLLRGVEGTTHVQDHPSRAGCKIIAPENI